MLGWRVVYHPGRMQPFTVYAPDGRIVQFCRDSDDVDAFIARMRGKRN